MPKSMRSVLRAMHNTFVLWGYFGGIRASTQRTFRFLCGESGNPEDNPSAVLRLKKVGHCNDLDEIAARAPQLAGNPSFFPRQVWGSSGGIVLNVP
jgi:hypothetical protein